MTNRRRRPTTVLPSDIEADELAHVLHALEQLANRRTTLMSAEGEQVVLPEPLFDVLRRVADALNHGQGVTVLPEDTQLTTQGAADRLGISRPTLVKLLERGELPFELVGRHRRVRLRDLESYRERSRAERRVLLRQMARDGQAAGLHEADVSEMLPREKGEDVRDPRPPSTSSITSRRTSATQPIGKTFMTSSP